MPLGVVAGAVTPGTEMAGTVTAGTVTAGTVTTGVVIAGTVTAGNIPVLISANNVTGSDKEKVLGSQARSTDARIPDLVLGMDVLHHLHIYAVFGQHRLYVTQVFFS